MCKYKRIEWNTDLENCQKNCPWIQMSISKIKDHPFSAPDFNIKTNSFSMINFAVLVRFFCKMKHGDREGVIKKKSPKTRKIFGWWFSSVTVKCPIWLEIQLARGDIKATRCNDIENIGRTLFARWHWNPNTHTPPFVMLTRVKETSQKLLFQSVLIYFSANLYQIGLIF